MPELISIITPTYNSQRFIESAIKSVLAQTYKNWEMIIIDDASTDGSYEIIKSFSTKDERIQFIKLDLNQGSAFARNKGIKEASGRYISFLDSDDLWMPEKLEKQLEFMDDHKASLSFTAYKKIEENGRYRGQVNINKMQIGYSDLLKTNHIGCLTAMIDTKLIGGKLYMPLIEKRHDHGLWLSILKQGYTAYGLNEILAAYRCRKGSISHNKINILFHQWKLYREVEKLGLFRSMYYMIYYIWYGIVKWRGMFSRSNLFYPTT